MNSSIEVFRQELAEFQTKSAAVIDELERTVSSREADMADFFYEQCDSLKSYLGANAANQEENEQAQEEAISAAEAWVAENVSGHVREEIASVLFLNGLGAGAALVLEAAEAIAA